MEHVGCGSYRVWDIPREGDTHAQSFGGINFHDCLGQKLCFPGINSRMKEILGFFSSFSCQIVIVSQLGRP